MSGSAVSHHVETMSGMARPCSVDGCEAKHVARGYCKRHYKQFITGPKRRDTEGPERICEACGKTYRTKRTGGRVCSVECRWFINPQTFKLCVIVWRRCLICQRWITRGAFCSDRCGRWESAQQRHLREMTSSSGRVWVAGSCRRCAQSFVCPLTNRWPGYCSAPCLRADSKDRRRALKRSAFVEAVYRRRIFERDKWRCHLCGKPVVRTVVVPHPLAPTVDHVVPLAAGGTHEPANCRTAHFICNSRKGDRGGGEQLALVG